ncbi:MAG: hypothetical protein HY786_09370, partial [Deltaproteobacteria bacterium]|nr:hypothetical protein [Deltaproteobacteria bacterium]
EKSVHRPVLVGGEMYQYYVPDNTGHYILYITKAFDPKKHPRTYSYLLPYKEKLSQKRETKKGLIPWYSLHWPRNPDLFKSPKIVCSQTSDTLIAAIDENGYYVLNSIIAIHILETSYDLKFIIALLNSKLLKFIYRNLTQEEDRIFAEVKPVNLRKLPIPRISFKTSEKKRKKKLAEAIALYEDYMLEFGQDMKGVTHGETASIKHNERVANFDSGREEEEIPGEHTGTGEFVYGLRGREGEQEDAGRVSEDTCQYILPIDFKKSRSGKQ